MNADKSQQKNEGEKEFSIQPIDTQNNDPKFAPFNAKGGPVQTKDMPEQEGSMEERRAKKEELNK